MAILSGGYVHITLELIVKLEQQLEIGGSISQNLTMTTTINEFNFSLKKFFE